MEIYKCKQYLILYENIKHSVIFDMKTNEIYNNKGVKIKNAYAFFNNFFSNDYNKHYDKSIKLYFQFLYHYLYRKRNIQYQSFYSVLNIYFIKLSNFQNFLLEGINIELDFDYPPMRWRFNKNAIINEYPIDFLKLDIYTQQYLSINKTVSRAFLMNYIGAEELSKYISKCIIEKSCYISINDFRNLLILISNKKNKKAIVNYIFKNSEDNKHFSDILTLYSDYRNMLLSPDDWTKNFDIFPSNLIREHDRAVLLYNEEQLNDKIKKYDVYKEEFDKIKFEFKDMIEYKDNDYSIIYPDSMRDILIEGTILSHCVGSYIDKIIRKECLIVFMRKNTDITKPYLTMELSYPKNRNIQIKQTKKYKNSHPDDFDNYFIHKIYKLNNDFNQIKSNQI